MKSLSFHAQNGDKNQKQNIKKANFDQFKLENSNISHFLPLKK